MSPDQSAEQRSRVRLNLALYLLVLLLAAVCVVGGVMAWQARAERAADEVAQERYGEVLAAATTEAEAFINIRYDEAQASIDAVAEGATGKFKEQYSSSSEEVIEVLEQNRSVMEGEVLWAGVVDLDPDSATVIAATEGTVANRQTENRPVVRNFRLKLSLVLEDGRWLTSDLEFVG